MLAGNGHFCCGITGGLLHGPEPRPAFILHPELFSQSQDIAPTGYLRHFSKQHRLSSNIIDCSISIIFFEKNSKYIKMFYLLSKWLFFIIFLLNTHVLSRLYKLKNFLYNNNLLHQLLVCLV